MQRLGQYSQRLVSIPDGSGILTAVDCLCLSFGDMSQKARCRERPGRILKRRYAGGPLRQRASKRPLEVFPPAAY